MNLRFIIFITIAIAVLSLASIYIGYRSITRWQWLMNNRGLVWIFLSLFVFIQVLGPALYRIYPTNTNITFIFHWIIYSTLGIFSCLFFYTVVADLLLLMSKGFSHSMEPVDLERRSFFAVAFMTLVSGLMGSWQAMRGPKVYEVDIPITNLPKDFDGFKIVQISDLHVGPTIGKEYVEGVVSLANELAPDLIALTGDFIDGSVAQLKEAISPLGNLKSKHGMYFITGNHEYYWGVTEWLEEFRRLGARVLLNEHVMIRKNDSEFVLAGVTDYRADQILPEHACDPKKALLGAPKESVKVLLAHQPSSYTEASAAGYDLQLSGHTHAGQYFPWNLIVAMAHRYYKGLNKHENMWVYVNRGTGYWGPPLRTGVPSEITLIRLRCA